MEYSSRGENLTEFHRLVLLAGLAKKLNLVEFLVMTTVLAERGLITRNTTGVQKSNGEVGPELGDVSNQLMETLADTEIAHHSAGSDNGNGDNWSTELLIVNGVRDVVDCLNGFEVDLEILEILDGEAVGVEGKTVGVANLILDAQVEQLDVEVDTELGFLVQPSVVGDVEALNKGVNDWRVFLAAEETSLEKVDLILYKE